MFARSQPPPDDLPETDLGAIYDETLPRVYGYLLVRLGGDAPTAEDLTQETYLSLARQIRERGMPPEVVPWLLHVARNKLIDHYRRAERTRQRFAPLLDEDALPPEPPTALARVHDRDQIRQALARLAESQRLAIALHYLDDLTVQQIAGLLGKSATAVESLLARGRAAMRAALTEYEERP
jgi:RNA polymerase sigma-70 factor (ECF subfamily)